MFLSLNIFFRKCSSQVWQGWVWSCSSWVWSCSSQVWQGWVWTCSSQVWQGWVFSLCTWSTDTFCNKKVNPEFSSN